MSQSKRPAIQRLIRGANRLLGSWAGGREVTLAPPAGSILPAFGFLAVLGFALQSVLHLVNLVWFDLTLNAINVDSDSSIFAWASTMATGAAAFAALLMAFVIRRKRYQLLLLAGLLAFLSLDDLVQIHEWVSSLAANVGLFRGAPRMFWVIAFAPLLGVAFLLLWRASTLGPSRAGRILRGGLLMLGAAVALEFITPIIFALGYDHGDLPYEIEAVVEEGLELSGWILIAGALAAGLLSHAIDSSPPAVREADD